MSKILRDELNKESNKLVKDTIEDIIKDSPSYLKYVYNDNIPVIYKSGYKYQLITPNFSKSVEIYPDKSIQEKTGQFIQLDQDGFLQIQHGYAWDGCSGPTLDDKTNMRAGLIHDALYQLMRQGLLSQNWREQADRELRKVCLEDGMSWIRAWYYYKAVRLFAASAAKPSSKKEILTAP